MRDSEVPGFWGALGLPGLFDAHVHFLPDRMQRKVWAYFDKSGPLTGRSWPIRYRLPVETRLSVLRGLGVRACFAGRGRWGGNKAAPWSTRMCPGRPPT